jgi:uncharacterized protein (UPF0264 family)
VTGLLVSVRSVAEAEEAWHGGARLIDVKEPRRGSLGRADDDAIQAVVGQIAGRCPVSAALGELRESSALKPITGLAYAKWGLSQCGQRADWRARLHDAAIQLQETNPACGPVAVAYADWQRAEAPHPLDVFAFARERLWPALLIDTWMKDGGTLLNCVPMPEIISLCHQCREADIRVALAGSLGAREIARLLVASPDWFAVRGAVCRTGSREFEIDPVALRQLVKVVDRKVASSR